METKVRIRSRDKKRLKIRCELERKERIRMERYSKERKLKRWKILRKLEVEGRQGKLMTKEMWEERSEVLSPEEESSSREMTTVDLI